MNEAERIAKRKLPVAVIDTENGFVKLGLAKKLAQKMDASYFRVDKLSEDSLLRVWRRMSRQDKFIEKHNFNNSKALEVSFLQDFEGFVILFAAITLRLLHPICKAQADCG